MLWRSSRARSLAVAKPPTGLMALEGEVRAVFAVEGRVAQVVPGGREGLVVHNQKLIRG